MGMKDSSTCLEKYRGRVLCLGFVAESSGFPKVDYAVIGIGMSVVDDHGVVVAESVACGHVENETRFGARMKEYWKNYPDHLAQLEYHGKFRGLALQTKMAREFQEFRATWEANAVAHGFTLVLCTHDTVKNAAPINRMIIECLTDAPLPQPASQVVKRAFDVHDTRDEMRGLLVGVNPAYSGDDLLGEIRRLYTAPKLGLPSNYKTLDSARRVAYEQQVIFGIRDGRIVLRQPFEGYSIGWLMRGVAAWGASVISG